MGEITLPQVAVPQVEYRLRVIYALFLPSEVWTFDDLHPASAPVKCSPPQFYIPSGTLCIPLDLITAARLHFIKPGDDSGLEETQWAWIKLIGLTGETKCQQQ